MSDITPPSSSSSSAGPSRLYNSRPTAPLPSPTATHRSPGRSNSVHVRGKGKSPAVHLQLDYGEVYRSTPPDPLSPEASLSPHSSSSKPRYYHETGDGNGGQLSPTSQTSTSTSSRPGFRRTVSEEDTRSLNLISPLSSMKDPQAALLQSARMKLSSQDQEAMRKLRLTMDFASSDTSSSSSPKSPLFPPGSVSHSHGSGSRGHPVGIGLRPRRSTLSKSVTADTAEDEDAKLDNSRDEAMDPDPDPDVEEQHQGPPTASSDFVIAVIGKKGVGKSTVIRRALKVWGISSPVSAPSSGGHIVSSSFAQIQPGGKLKGHWKVEFVEMDIAALDIEGDGTPWPNAMTRVAGVIICYDAQQSDTIAGIDVIIDRITSDGTPMVLFACKSDPDAILQVDAAHGNSIGEPYNVGLIEVTTMTPDGKSKMRNGLRWLLYKLEQRYRRARQRSHSALSTPLRIKETALHDPVSAPDSDASSGRGHSMWHGPSDRGTARKSEEEGISDTRSSSSSLQWMMRNPLLAPPGDSQVKKGDMPPLPVLEVKQPDVPDPPLYLPLSEIFDQVFAAVISTENDTLIHTFFLTYRKFCQPLDVMKEFMSRFRDAERPGVPKYVQMWALQKMAGALIDWTTAYPHDLLESATAQLFREVLALVLQHTFMAHLTVELVFIEEKLSSLSDIDLSWSRKPVGNTPATPRGSMADASGAVLYDLDSNLSKADSAIGSSQIGISHSKSSLDLHNAPEGNTTDVRSNGKASGSESRLHTTSSISEGAHSITSADDLGPLKWTQAVMFVLNHDPKVFAIELTRMQWELYKTIRARDVFRHDFGKEEDTPVGKSIAFFNQISRWTTTIILASPKAKQRARVYERFTLIAHQLRRLNDYDSLYAVISGMRETSIHRLSNTHSLVQLHLTVEKDWQSHLKLMDPRGGYVHYRRALEADISHGRPAIPLLTTILGLVSRLQTIRREDVRPSDLLVQWDKFLRFGEILAIIPRCQIKEPILPPGGAVTTAFRGIIEITQIITDEDGLFERSRMLEPGMNAGGTLMGTSTGGKVLRRLVNLGLA